MPTIINVTSQVVHSSTRAGPNIICKFVLSCFTISISKKKEIYVTEKGELWGYALKTGPNLEGKKKNEKCDSSNL